MTVIEGVSNFKNIMSFYRRTHLRCAYAHTCPGRKCRGVPLSTLPTKICPMSEALFSTCHSPEGAPGRCEGAVYATEESPHG